MQWRRIALRCTIALFAVVLVGALILPMGFPSERALKSAVRDADRIVIRSGGLCHRRVEEEKVLFEISGPGKVSEFIDMIQIRPLKGGLRCMCCGKPTFEFYRDGEQIAAVGFHHGKSIRWGGWRVDGFLTKQSAEGIVETLRANGLAEEQFN